MLSFVSDRIQQGKGEWEEGAYSKCVGIVNDACIVIRGDLPSGPKEMSWHLWELLSCVQWDG